MSFLSHLLSIIGEFFAGLFKQAETAYDHLEKAEQEAIKQASGLVNIVNNNLDKNADQILPIIQQFYPDLSLDVIHGFLDIVMNKITLVKDKTPLTLEEAVEALKQYLADQTDRNGWIVASQGVVNLIAAELIPSTPIQKIALLIEYVFQHFIKGKVQ